MLKRKNSQIIVAILLAVAAFAVTLQIRSTSSTEFSHLRQGELVELLKSVESSTSRLEAQIAERTEVRNSLLTATQTSKEAQEAAKKRADDVAILAGTVATQGPGITVIINNKSGAVDANVLLDAMSELRDGGAEAIEINQKIRVVAHTYFVDRADGPMADDTKITTPIRIDAIGDPSTLYSALRFPGGLVDKIESRGATIKIAQSEKIMITAVTKSKPGRYAQVQPAN